MYLSKLGVRVAFNINNSKALNNRSWVHLFSSLQKTSSSQLEATGLSKVEKLKKQAQDVIWTNTANRNPSGVLTGLVMAKRERIELDMRDYMAGVNAATEFNGNGYDIAFWAYGMVRKDRVVPVDMFMKLMRICLNFADVKRSIQLMDDYKECGHPGIESMLVSLLQVLTKSTDPDHKQLLTKHFEEFKELGQTKAIRSQPLVFMHVATYFCRIGESQGALDALSDMTEADHEPTAMLCAPLLDAALFVADTNVLRVLSIWYANNFDAPLEQGVLLRMMQIAAFNADTELAQVTCQIMSKAELPMTGAHFACLVRTCLLAGDVISAVEALQQMEQLRVTFASDFQEESLRALMVRTLASSGSTAALDELYFALADQARSEGAVPRLALDALVEAAGRLDQNDRAFATFNEYSSVFGLAPDIHSYNALLASAACGRFVNMHTLLAILEQIESGPESATPEGEASKPDPNSDSKRIVPNCTPNRRSFTILLEAIVESGELQVLDEVLRYMDQKGVEASSRALRRVIVAFARKGDMEKVDHVRKILRQKESNRDIPWFLRSRITDLLRLSAPAVEAPKEAVDVSSL